MKRFLIHILYIVLLSGCASKNNCDKISVDLNKGWMFRKEGSTKWMSAKVPGCVHTDLRFHDSIPDPFLNDNELQLQWIDKTDWEYQLLFDIPKDMQKKNNIFLAFEGLDTYADVYLNDSLLLSSDNMYCHFEKQCKSLLKNSANKLFICFRSPVKEGLKKLEASPYALPAVNDHSKDGGLGNKLLSPFIRKAPYQFGWDWGPRFVTSGIWKPVHLIGWDHATIEDVQIIQNSLTEEKAELTAVIKVVANGNYPAELTVMDSGSQKVISSIHTNLKSGINKMLIDFKVDKPKRWWPNGMGEHPVYTIQSMLSIDGKKTDEYISVFGLRTIQLIQKADSVGQSFYFEVNGIPVFMRGANYIPINVFPTMATDSDYLRVIGRAVESNMNMIRVWGGGIYEKDIFYDLCDRNGILVWQDFMFACAMYPGDNDFKRSITKEITQNVIRLRNHPCIALWCGNNELENGWNYYLSEGMNYTPLQKKEIWKNYLSIFDTLIPGILDTLKVSQTYRSTSASPGKGIYEKTPVDHLLDVEWRSGDWHDYWVWGGKKPFSLYDQYIGRFMSEWGFQAFPDRRTVKTFSTSKNPELNSSLIQQHQKSNGGNALIDFYMNMYYNHPKDFPMYIYVSGLLQADAMGTAIESHRRHKPHCMGTLYWQLNDMWPVVSWSTIDFYNRPKASHFAVHRCYKNILLSSTYEKNKLKVYLISDEMKDINGTLQMQIRDFDGRIIWEKAEPIQAFANQSNEVFSIDISQLKNMIKNKSFFHASFISNGKVMDEKTQYFVSPKELLLEKATIKMSIQNNMITLLSDKLAKNVFLNVHDGENNFRENYFDLLPGKSKNIIFTSENKQLKSTDLTIISLIDSYNPH